MTESNPVFPNQHVRLGQGHDGGTVLTEESRIITSELRPLIGTAIEVDSESLLSGRFAKDIRALLEERSVLVFRGVGFDDEQQIAFTRTLGTQAYENNGVPLASGEKQAIFKVSLDATVNPIGEYLRTSFFWHLDGSMHEVPILASILSARFLPPGGGADRVVQHIRRIRRPHRGRQEGA